MTILLFLLACDDTSDPPATERFVLDSWSRLTERHLRVYVLRDVQVGICHGVFASAHGVTSLGPVPCGAP